MVVFRQTAVSNNYNKTIVNKRLISLVLFILSVLTPGCEQQSEYIMAIMNNSSDTINVYFTGNSAYVNGTESVIALPNKETVYYTDSGWTIKDKNMECDPHISYDEVSVVTSSERTFLKNIWDKEEWTCETGKNNSYWKMIFKIEESDFE